MEFMCLDFVNSEWRDFRDGRREDRLLQLEWRARFLKTWKLDTTGPLEPANLAVLSALRALLRSMLEDLVTDRTLATGDLAALNQFLSLAPGTRRLVRAGDTVEFRFVFIPASLDWNWVIAEVAASFAGLLAGYDYRRLKTCQNDNCGWIFYDASRNQAQRWCEAATCANLMKVRRFRARQQAAYNKLKPASVT